MEAVAEISRWSHDVIMTFSTNRMEFQLRQGQVMVDRRYQADAFIILQS